jgi:transglutaminase-like putative cysteine protease
MNDFFAAGQMQAQAQNQNQSDDGSLSQTQSQTQTQTQGPAATVLPALPPLPPLSLPDGQAPGPRRLSVVHQTRYNYDTPVEVAHHSAWLRPRDTAGQQLQHWALQIDPPPDSAVQESRDVFGNWRHGFSHSRMHDTLTVTSRFQVVLAQPPQHDSPHSPPWEVVAQALRYRAGVTQPDAVEFVLPSHFAPQHARLADFARGLFTPGRPLLHAAQALMDHIFRHMAFKPQTTDVATNALQALDQGQGVCQDFAHLMIGAMRSLGLAARYVSGYLLTQPPAGQPRLIGADASHAWVAVWCPVHGWVALDPTNNLWVGQDHVTLAWGRDYADVAPLRGVIRGGGMAPPLVGVTVEPVPQPVGLGVGPTIPTATSNPAIT